MLTIKQLSKSIQHQPILKDITLDLTEGYLMICGKSGSGKSTLAKIIAGLDLDYTGQIKYNGISRKDTQMKRWMKQIQYVPQYQSNTLDYRKRVRDILLAPLKNYHFDPSTYQERIAAVLKQCLLPQSILDQRVSTLSGGQFQRLWITKALIIEPQILILDEATTNLDIINEETILNMLKELTQIQMIIISHDPYVIDYFKGQRLDLDL
ncbi:ABC transporter ATP-binding protein [Staphylococcus warneri]